MPHHGRRESAEMPMGTLSHKRLWAPCLTNACGQPVSQEMFCHVTMQLLQRDVPEVVGSHSVTHTQKKHPVMGLKIHDHAHKSLSLDHYPDPLSICVTAFLDP